MGVGSPRLHWPPQPLRMSITALPGAVPSNRFGSPERIGRLPIPDKAHLSDLDVRACSGVRPILASAAADVDRFSDRAAPSWQTGRELSGGVQIREGGPKCH